MRSLIENWPEGPAAGTAGAAAPRVDGIGEDRRRRRLEADSSQFQFSAESARATCACGADGRLGRAGDSNDVESARGRSKSRRARPVRTRTRAELWVHGCHGASSREAWHSNIRSSTRTPVISLLVYWRAARSNSMWTGQPASAGVARQRFPYSSSSSSASRASRDGPSTSASRGTSSASSPRAARRAVLAARRSSRRDSNRSRI